jgi:hypothetical protein
MPRSDLPKQILAVVSRPYRKQRKRSDFEFAVSTMTALTVVTL